MPNNRKITKKTIKGKEGLHPGSRKAGQLARVQLRTSKLQSQARVRKDASSARLQRPLFFLHSLSSPAPLSLPSLKALIDLYISRNDSRIDELTSARRPGRPKEKELLDLEEVRRRELKEFDTGFEVPDLTHGPTTRLMFSWIESGTNMDSSHVDLLRMMRVFMASDEVVLSRKGRTEGMGLGKGVAGEGEDWTEAKREEERGAREMEVEA